MRDKKKGDLSRWRAFEYDLHEMERTIINTHTGVDIGDLEMVDFNETEEVYTPMERRQIEKADLDMGLIDLVDIVLSRNPDLESREDAEEYLAERKKSSNAIRQKSDTPKSLFKLGG